MLQFTEFHHDRINEVIQLASALQDNTLALFKFRDSDDVVADKSWAKYRSRDILELTTRTGYSDSDWRRVLVAKENLPDGFAAMCTDSELLHANPRFTILPLESMVAVVNSMGIGKVQLQNERSGKYFETSKTLWLNIGWAYSVDYERHGNKRVLSPLALDIHCLTGYVVLAQSTLSDDDLNEVANSTYKPFAELWSKQNLERIASTFVFRHRA